MEVGKKQSKKNIIKSIRNKFKLKKENEAMKDRFIKDIRTLFKVEDDNYKPVSVGNFWNSNYLKNESSGNRNQNLSVNKYLDKIKLYLRDIIINIKSNLKKSDLQKIHLTMAINFLPSKDFEEEREMQ